jgi:hypothetical protein
MPDAGNGAVIAVIVATLVLLSMILMATTVFPSINVKALPAGHSAARGGARADPDEPRAVVAKPKQPPTQPPKPLAPEVVERIRVQMLTA